MITLTPEFMTDEQAELAREIMDLLRKYRGTFNEKKPFIWIENHETGEFLAYTLGEAREQMKEKLGDL